MPTAQEYETSIVNQLRITDPTLNTGLGTPVRKIISAVATEIANYSVDMTTTNTLYALNAVSGQELDYLVGQFGFTRQEARSARGTIRVYRDNADAVVQISYGSQFYKPASATSPAIVFQTTAYQELAEGILSAEIAVIATTPGASGNVPADTITYSNTYTGYINATNDAPTTGGRDTETDEELRTRFLNTVFRNESGTKDQYLGLALANVLISRANLVGQESRFSEIVQVYRRGTDNQMMASVSVDRWNAEVDHVLDPKNRYWVRLTDSDELMGRGEYEVLGSGDEIMFHRRAHTELVGPVVMGERLKLTYADISDVSVVSFSTGEEAEAGEDYVVDAVGGYLSIPANTSILTGDSLRVTYRYFPVQVDDFVTIEFDYLSNINRGELKSVELLVDGLDVQKVSDIQYLDFNKVIDVENQANWERDDGTQPTIGHVYVPVSYQPSYSSIGQVNVGTSTILIEDKHYRMIFDSSKRRGSSRGLDAIELLGSLKQVNGSTKFVFDDTKQPNLSDETPMNIPYYYNKVIGTVQQLIDDQSVVTMDCLVHEARRRYFGVYLTLMYSSFPREEIKNQVISNVITWAKNLPFGSVIQFSDIETVAANTPGVDNVRVSLAKDCGNNKTPFSGGSDVAACGIVECCRDGSTFVQQYTSDFQLTQQDVFEVQFVEVYSRTQQNW